MENAISEWHPQCNRHRKEEKLEDIKGVNRRWIDNALDKRKATGKVLMSFNF